MQKNPKHENKGSKGSRKDHLCATEEKKKGGRKPGSKDAKPRAKRNTAAKKTGTQAQGHEGTEPEASTEQGETGS